MIEFRHRDATGVCCGALPAMLRSASPLSTRTDNIPGGILLIVGFAAIIPFVSGAVKTLGQSGIAAPEITLVRFFIQVVLIGSLLLVLNRGLGEMPKPLWAFVLRGLLIAAGSGFLYAGLAFLALADNSAILFVQPLIMTAASALFLGEAVGWRRWGAVFVGFIGAIVVIGPNFEDFGFAAILPGCAALCYTGAVMLTRRFAAQGSAFVFMLTTSVTACAVLAPLLGLGALAGIPGLQPQWPTASEIYLLVIIGLVATGTNLMLTQAFRIAPSSTLAPFLYLEIVGSMIVGFFVFGDVPRLQMLFGGSIVVGAGVFVWWRESVRSRARQVSARAPEASARAPRFPSESIE